MQIPIGTGLALGHVKAVVQNHVAAVNATFEDTTQTAEQLQDEFGALANKITKVYVKRYKRGLYN